jgi:hypothetical protein
MTDEWKERVQFPIGMDDKGNFFSYIVDKVEKAKQDDTKESKSKSIWTRLFGE